MSALKDLLTLLSLGATYLLIGFPWGIGLSAIFAHGYIEAGGKDIKVVERIWTTVTPMILIAWFAVSAIVILKRTVK